MQHRSTSDQRALGWILCRDLAAQLKARDGGDLTADELHDYFLLERFGERERVIYGRMIRRPAKTFSQLSKLEMSDMIDFIIQWARTMQLSISIPADRSYQELARDAGQ